MKRTPEVSQLATQFAQSHTHEAASLACLWHLSSNLLTQFGHQNKADLSPMVDLLLKLMNHYTATRGMPSGMVGRAVVDLHRAGRTAQYLDSLPD